MFLSMNWIGDFVDLSGLDKKALIRNFTLSTAEVEDIYEKGQDTHGVIVARILSVAPHPNSKKLHLLTVDTGHGTAPVVCGAPNVREGMTVAFAQEGASVCGHDITVATVAGYESAGMCCSEAELGISDDHSGLMEITDPIPLGTDLKTVYDIDDIIFEVDNKSLTNRPDLWGHYGIAREFATITGRPLRAPAAADLTRYADLPGIPVEVRQTSLVYRYTALRVENITRHLSPVNMRIRLYYCGSRAINFLADLTNYVMMELGQPMHAFDCERVDRIEVQTLPGHSSFTTLDGIARDIDESTLMITSHDAPVAIAGIMGGDASKIEDGTHSLLLESATFDGVSVRKSSARLGLRTDASMRYEKMLDPELCAQATARLIALLAECDHAARVTSSFTDVYVRHYPTIRLTFDKSYVDRYTGIDIPESTICRTLTGLGFTVEQDGHDFTVTVPTWRATKDVTIKADIIEEISRIYGYDNFAVGTSVSPLRPVREEVQKSEEDRIKDILVQCYQMHEVHSYIWSDSAANRELEIETPENVRILNAQTPEHCYLRTSLIPTLLHFVRENRAYANTFGLFEIGHTVEGTRPSDGYCNEKKKLGAVLFSKTEGEETLFHTCRDAIVEILDKLLHKAPLFRSTDTVSDYEHPVNTFEVVVDGTVIGRLSVPHPTVLAHIDRKCAVAFFELVTDALATVPAASLSYRAPSRFPAIDIDITFLADASAVDFPAVVSAAGAVTDDMLTNATVKDIYTDESGATALTLRFSFAAPDRTLTKQELQPKIDAVIAALAPLGLVWKN